MLKLTAKDDIFSALVLTAFYICLVVYFVGYLAVMRMLGIRCAKGDKPAMIEKTSVVFKIGHCILRFFDLGLHRDLLTVNLKVPDLLTLKGCEDKGAFFILYLERFNTAIVAERFYLKFTVFDKCFLVISEKILL